MARKPNVLIVARSAGAASALGPVARALIDGGNVKVSIVGYAYAQAVFQRYGLPLLRMEDEEKPDTADRLLDQEQPNYLLTGTSSDALLDCALWAAARVRSIPTMAVLDHWFNYAERFTGSDGVRFGCMPDWITVIDETEYRGMIDAGCSPHRLIITGQPAFDDLINLDHASLRESSRATLEIDPDVKLVVFASEPIANYFGTETSTSGPLGYTEVDALNLLLDSLDDLVPSKALAVIVKVHPIEDPGLLLGVVQKRTNVNLRLLKEFAPRQLMAACDVATGMTSIFLLEAALMGRPAISLQPSQLSPDGFTGNQREFIELALSQKECRSLLAVALTESDETWRKRRKRAQARGFDGLASQRIASLIYKELGLSAREVGIADSG